MGIHDLSHGLRPEDNAPFSHGYGTKGRGASKLSGAGRAPDERGARIGGCYEEISLCRRDEARVASFFELLERKRVGVRT